MIKLPEWLQILAIAAVSSLPNVIRLATITKVQVFNRAPDTSFNGGVCRFRSTCPRGEMYKQKVGAEVAMIRELMLLLL